jgi:hypothetical protein
MTLTQKNQSIMKNLILFTLAAVMISCGNKPHQASTDLVHVGATAQGNTQATQTGKPVIQFEKLEHDFGTMTQGEVLEYEFRFTNTGNADLLVTNAVASCGCTIPEYPKEPVRPGEKGKIRIKFDSKMKIDRFRKEVYITANTEPAQTTLMITGLIKAKPENPAQKH